MLGPREGNRRNWEPVFQKCKNRVGFATVSDEWGMEGSSWRTSATDRGFRGVLRGQKGALRKYSRWIYEPTIEGSRWRSWKRAECDGDRLEILERLLKGWVKEAQGCLCEDSPVFAWNNFLLPWWWNAWANLKEDNFVLAHSYSLWAFGSVALRGGGTEQPGRSTWGKESAHLVAVRKQRQGWGLTVFFKGYLGMFELLCSQILIFYNQPHLLNTLLSPQ